MEQEPKSRWAQPLTFVGVGRFAEKSGKGLLGFQLAVALLSAAAVTAFFEVAWAPVLQRAIASLPATGTIENGTLIWPESTPVRTGGSSFLWISVDPENSLEAGQGADLLLEVGRTELRLRSLLGYAAIPYLKGYRIALNRTELEPWWGAWRPVITAGVALATVCGLLATWWALAIVYTWPARFIAFYADRDLSWTGAWRMSAACLLPGALFFAFAIAAYTFQRMNIVQFLAASLLHIMIGWVYLLFAPFCLPRKDAGEGRGSRSGNPFSRSAVNVKEANPFSEQRRRKS